ncbi:hypothetical protein [Phreatobacter oligotrophus]|uniref:Uncharacterized protein n=1 Tax=Phreatobacter oligotrophus TaxID=1122261 RepID=A0A2T4YYN4_9HYPH|nr:hypothetical protein [Phreatobacter oligotrophus]PTM51819.1 hypothetical protein C8P69_109106 [Phreatobacter oligotrophus]
MRTNRKPVTPLNGDATTSDDALLALIGAARAVAYEAKGFSATATFCLEMGVLELEKEWQSRNGNVVKIFPTRPTQDQA